MNVKEKIKFIEDNFKVINKTDQLVPLVLFPAQRHFIENRGVRNVCLKGRQMGFSTGVEADASADLFTVPYQRQVIITHDSETSEFLFQNVQRFYRNLPWNIGRSDTEMEPIHDWRSGTRMRFPIVDSYIYIDSARSDSIGIGHTISRCHNSELARWPDAKARQLWADITQTVPMGAILTAESTPQGRFGLFYELYDDAKKGRNGFNCFFYPWWWDPNYKADPLVYMTPEKADMLASILQQSTTSFLKDEKSISEHFELSPEQLSFRRMKIGEIKLLFFQEYPENDIDCWMSTQMSVVDANVLRPYHFKIKEGRTEGNLTIWKDAIGGRKYAIGVDVAAGYAKGDYSVASVLDVRTMEYVARLRGRIPPDMFAEEVYRLGIRYNEAELAVERVGHGHSVIKVLLEKGYPNIYYHIEYDDTQGRTSPEPGWKTSVKTKPMMVADLIAALRAEDLISFSENLILEASGLVWEGQQKVKTVEGGYDDEWDAVSIALQIREQTPILEERRPVVTTYATI